MKRTCLSQICLALLLLAACCSLTTSRLAAEELSAEEKAAGFTPMFNGKDFTGWRFSGDLEAPNWEVTNGVIHLSGGGKPHLVTVDEYGDFEMRFEWRSVGAKGYNSGFYIRTPANAGKNQLNLAKGNEGAIVGGKIEGAKGVGSLQKPAGEWNTWRVVVAGDKVEFYCNGELAWTGTGLQPEKGHIGFQAEGAAMEFRNLRIRKIQ
ncbi:3-keto-disaccharide hydrolase [Lignipirellula cremea]|uniref:3-keto-alpha-glucoside-1,2-lyase/3-keto-2-hydroxy-glucal hydratase domain-containing protein n=1 Tax=Lignipirellula cremea TaxID=2528010 RepID=A0A518DS39_9BACT|nr:DUF1080 domain-containing protein [Lignipirellula cremea]QDU94657.1 hypothetical protein Pla8534_24630 [Lignipirellula cremea]